MNMRRKLSFIVGIVMAIFISVASAPSGNGRSHSAEDIGSDSLEGQASPVPMSPIKMMDMMRNMRVMGLAMPALRSDRGRKLFASKGCVVCHSVNGVGGEHAPALDAATMPRPMNPFEFAAKMWRGAEAMIALQRDELGEPIELNGEELADIIAFVHDAKQQKKFSKADIPHRIEELMSEAHDGPNGHRNAGHHTEDD